MELEGRRMLERVVARLYDRLADFEVAGTLSPQNPEARAVGEAISLLNGILHPGPAILPKDRWA